MKFSWFKNLYVTNGFTEKELISFGNYLLSKERNKKISKENKLNVTDADLANWKDSIVGAE